jgi:hypothetical protein
MRLALLLAHLLPVLALPSLNRAACQHPTRNPLSGCPAGTLLVGPGAPFRTIQSAVLSLGNTTTPSHILILPGNYTEQVNITLAAPLYLLGQTACSRSRHANAVNVIWRNATGAGIVPNIDNAYTSTLTVAPTLNASLTGTGPTGFAVPADTPFGSADFRAYNINFINDFADHAVGPALAVSVSYANAGFYFCGFYSYQDTVRSCPPFPPPVAVVSTDADTDAGADADGNTGLHRQTRQRVLPRERNSRASRLPVRLRDSLDPILTAESARVRRRHYRVEGDEYDDGE